MDYTKDELMLLNGIIKLALEKNIVQKTEGVIALRNKISEQLKTEIKVEGFSKWCKKARGED